MNKQAAERDILNKAIAILTTYKRFNPKGNYLNISFVQTGEHEGRIHINNAFYDRDHAHAIDITEEIPLP